MAQWCCFLWGSLVLFEPTRAPCKFSLLSFQPPVLCRCSERQAEGSREGLQVVRRRLSQKLRSPRAVILAGAFLAKLPQLGAVHVGWQQGPRWSVRVARLWR